MTGGGRYEGLTESSGDISFMVDVTRAPSMRKDNGMPGAHEPWHGQASWTSSTIAVGTLVLDMYDPGTKQLVWTGRASKTIDPSSNHEKNMKKPGQGHCETAEELSTRTEVTVTTVCFKVSYAYKSRARLEYRRPKRYGRICCDSLS